MNPVSIHAERGSRFVKHCTDIALGRLPGSIADRIESKSVPAGTTDGDYDGGWGADAVTPGAAEFLGLLRAQTIIGRLATRGVPFRTPVVKRTGGGLFMWRGAVGAKTVTSVEYGKTRLIERTAAGIVVLTRELLNASGAENDVRRELTDGLVAFHDSAFIDPSVAEVADVSPASITYGADPISSTGDAGEDLRELVAAIQSALETLAGVVLVMSEATAWGIATTVPGAFPQGVTGGLFGLLPVVLSAAAGQNIVAVHQPSIIVAEGALRVDMATDAALEMAATPGTGAQALVSLWQTNSIALRVERTINWEVAREGAVQYVSGADYGVAS